MAAAFPFFSPLLRRSGAATQKVKISTFLPHFLPVSSERETDAGKERLKWRLVLSSADGLLILAVPLLLSLLTVGRSKLDCFLLP